MGCEFGTIHSFDQQQHAFTALMFQNLVKGKFMSFVLYVRISKCAAAKNTFCGLHTNIRTAIDTPCSKLISNVGWKDSRTCVAFAKDLRACIETVLNVVMYSRKIFMRSVASLKLGLWSFCYPGFDFGMIVNTLVQGFERWNAIEKVRLHGQKHIH